jgi:hypothetical protein
MAKGMTLISSAYLQELVILVLAWLLQAMFVAKEN